MTESAQIKESFLRLTSDQDVKDLLADIRSAWKRASRNGGIYGIYRKNTAGEYLLRIEIQVH